MLPLAGLLFGVVRDERHIQHGERWEFVIDGYDPRDLLRGRYLRYTLELNRRDFGLPKCEDSASCCTCLMSSSPNTPPDVQSTLCEVAKDTCDGFINAKSLKQLDRFYIPEARAKDLEDTLRSAARDNNATLVVRTDRFGTAIVEDLLIGGVPILDLGLVAPPVVPPPQ